MRYWLPAIGIVVGLSMMGIAVLAQGQTDAGQAAPSAVEAQPGGGHDFHGRDGGRDWRRGDRGFRHRMFAMSPERFCTERYARQAGFLSYLQAKLSLTDAQKPLWDKYQQAMMDAAQKRRQSCIQNAGTKWSEMSALDRRQRIEQMLKARLDDLQSTDQPLQALYQALTPDQHKILDRPFPGRHPGR